jgi:hypothetical protein
MRQEPHETKEVLADEDLEERGDGTSHAILILRL